VDDIIIFSRSISEHISNVTAVLDRLLQHNLKIKPSKSHFFCRNIKFLGFNVSTEGISTDTEKISPILRWTTPRNIKELKSFLGSCSYYRAFISHFSDISEPLYALLRKGNKFTWNDKTDKAFVTLKSRLTVAPVLALPRDDMEYILDVDASDIGLGVVLGGLVDGHERPIAYASRPLNDSERKYCITRREMLSLVYGLQKFRQYLLGRSFKVRTDHAPLVTLKSKPNPSSQLCRWIDLIEEYDFSITHRPGIRHSNADSLTREGSLCHQCEATAELYKNVDDMDIMESYGMQKAIRSVQCNALKSSKPPTQNGDTYDNDIAMSQQLDPDIGPLYSAMVNNEDTDNWPKHSHCGEVAKAYLTQQPLMVMHNKIIYRKWIDATG
jgi:hypothetical protein